MYDITCMQRELAELRQRRNSLIYEIMAEDDSAGRFYLGRRLSSLLAYEETLFDNIAQAMIYPTEDKKQDGGDIANGLMSKLGVRLTEQELSYLRNTRLFGCPCGNKACHAEK